MKEKLPSKSPAILGLKRSDFYCLNCLHSSRTKNKLESHKKVCENQDFCNVIMPFVDTKISEFNQYQKPDQAPFIIYADLECIMEKIDGCKNDSENRSGFSIFTISSFRSKENKHDVYSGKNCMKKSCEFLREHAMKIFLKRKK